MTRRFTALPIFSEHTARHRRGSNRKKSLPWERVHCATHRTGENFANSSFKQRASRSKFCQGKKKRNGLAGERSWESRRGKRISQCLISAGEVRRFVSAVRDRILERVSLDVGCVRITERLLHATPPTDEEIASARRLIGAHFGKVGFLRTGITHAIGVAGTVTTIASMQLQLARYDPAKVHGYTLHYDDVQRSFDLLKRKTLSELASIPQISAGRADILLAGVVILLEFMEHAGLGKITVSDRGLRYGMILREIERRRASH